jgi:hypothetical protein
MATQVATAKIRSERPHAEQQISLGEAEPEAAPRLTMTKTDGLPRVLIQIIAPSPERWKQINNERLVVEIAMNHSKQGQPPLVPTKSTDQYLSGESEKYVGRNPATRITIAALFLLLVLQIATGVVLGAPIYSGHR